MKNIFVRVSNRTLSSDVFEDVIDHNKRNVLVIFLKNSNIYYIGELKLRTENDKNYYMTLINYNVYDKESRDLIRSHVNTPASVVINLEEVSSVETFYEDDSELWKWLNKDGTKN